MVGKNHRLDGLVNCITVLSCEHVDFALIKTQLAHISLQEEDIGALHARVHDLRSGLFVTFATTHDLPALFDSSHRELARNIDHN